MIDTVVLILEMGKFSIKDPNKFSPPADFTKDRIKDRKAGNYKYICNPTKQQQEQYYFPRLTLMQQCFGNGNFAIKLKIEFSAPKLLFKNNFTELDDGIFNLVIDNLLKKLDEMSIYTTKQQLANAYIQKIDYSKNIILDDFTTCSMVISELSKLNLNARMDLTKTNYRNDGQAIAYHSGQFEIKIYDKIKDLEQGKKFGKNRSMESESQYQPDLFNYKNYRERLVNREVLRFEIRLFRRKLKTLLSKLSIKASLTFKDLFSEEISKKVINHFMEEVLSSLRVMRFDLNSVDNLIASIKATKPNIRPKTILEIVGFIQIAQEIGSRGARVELNLKNHQWYRIQKLLKEIEINHKNYRFLSILELESKLKKFEPIKFEYK